MLDGTLAEADASRARVDQLSERYRPAMQGIQVGPKDLHHDYRRAG